MRIVLVAALALAGCGAAPKSDAGQLNESAVLAELQNRQDAVYDTIERDAGRDSGADAAGDNGSDARATAAAAAMTRYGCDNGLSVIAVYGADDGSAQLTIGKKSLALPSVSAASGSKYASEDGLEPGKSLTWWVKGDEALLIQAPKGATGGAQANCKVVR